MVAPRLPNHAKRKRRRRKGDGSQLEIGNRVLLIPVGLASLAILYNIVRLCRSIARPQTKHTLSHRLEDAAVDSSSWTYEWCDSAENCHYYVPLDLEDFLPPLPDEPLLEMVVPDAEDIGALFAIDDDNSGNNKHTSSDKHSSSSNKTATKPSMTDDLDNHLDRLGNMIMNPTKYMYPPTPRILVQARHNMTLVGRTNHTTQSQQQHFQPGSYFALLSRRGLGDYHFTNQDRAVLIDPYPVLMSKKQQRSQKSHPLHNNFFLGIFDGHGSLGHRKADFAATTLPQYLLERLSKKLEHGSPDMQVGILKALESSFVEAHRQGPMIHDSGCTASIIVRLRQQVYFANTGDSRSFLLQIDTSNGNVTIEHMTKPHKPDDPLERQRIVGAGCIVIDPDPFHDPTARVAESWDGGLALAMSRSLGDYDLEHCGVIPTPTVTVVNLDEYYTQKGVILLAVSVTDGMFDYVSFDEIARGLSLPFLKGNLYFASETSPLELAAEDLIRTASDRWLLNTTLYPYRDDITLAVRRVQ